MTRIKQYLKAKRARINDNDIKFLKEILNADELAYFNKLPLFEKRHSLDVCYYLINNYGIKDVDILKAGLFHDIGKIEAKITPEKKAIAVLLKRIGFLSTFFGNNIRFLNVYYNHPELSSKICKKLGMNEVTIYIIKHHHDKDISDENILKFQKADREN